MGEQPARWVHLAQFMDISGFRGVFGGEIGSVTSKHFRLDDNGISVYIPYPFPYPSILPYPFTNV